MDDACCCSFCFPPTISQICFQLDGHLCPEQEEADELHRIPVSVYDAYPSVVSPGFSGT